MRTRSTSVALTILTIVGFSTLLVSCSPDRTTALWSTDDATPAGAANAQSLHDQLAWTGKYHNDALAYARAKVKESREISNFGKCKAGLAALKEFQKAFRKAGGNAVFGDLTLTDGMCEAAGSLSNRVSASVGLDPGGLTPSADISPLANDYMNQILNQIDAATSVSSLASAISAVESQAGASVGSLEAVAVVTTGSIAVNSADYWSTDTGTATDNGPAPYARSANQSVDLLGDQFKASSIGLSERTKKIIKADVSAAIGVFLYDWWMGEAAIAKACVKAAAASLIAGIYFT